MGLKTAADYLASLRDGRVTYWDGERIDDITTHPRFRVPIAVASRDYAYDDAKLGDLRSYETAEGGRAHRIYQVPRDEADLARRVELMNHTSIVGLVSGVYMALMSVKDAVEKVNPQYARNIEAMYRHARDDDLRAAEVITDAKGDRKRKAHEQDDPDLYLRIVERRNDGIVVRGAKLHITGASLCHELVVMPTKGMRQDETDYAVSFSVPVNTKGVKIINRSFAPAELNEFDYPASAHHSIPEGFVVFDDVFVPWERVFLAGEVQLAILFAQSLGLWERTGGVVDAVRVSQILVGLAQLVTEHQGKDRDPVAQNSVAELIKLRRDAAHEPGPCLPALRAHAVGHDPSQYARHQRGQVLLGLQLPHHDPASARRQRRAGDHAATGGRPQERGIGQVSAQVPAQRDRCGARDPHARLQPDPRSHGRRDRKSVV